MKLKPLGKRFYRYKVLSVISFIGLFVFSRIIPWYVGFCTSLVGAVIFPALYIDIAIDAYTIRYGLNGEKGPNPFWIYEPGDPEYEDEKILQDD